jgi:hypothetical protein
LRIDQIREKKEKKEKKRKEKKRKERKGAIRENGVPGKCFEVGSRFGAGSFPHRLAAFGGEGSTH